MFAKLSIHKRAWITGLFGATVLWICVLAFSGYHFDVNDDQFILRALTGEEAAFLFPFNFHVQSFITAPLIGLARLFPLLPWFSLLLIGLMWLSTATLIKSIIVCSARSRFEHGFLMGVFLAVCFVLLYVYYLCVVLTYSAVAGVVCAAAAAHLMSIDHRNASGKRIILSSLYSLGLLVIAYGLRDMAVFPGLAFCGIVFLYRFFTCFGLGRHAKRSARPMVITLLAVLVVLGGAMIAREAEINLRGRRDFVDWQQVRMDVIDYIDFDQISDETLEHIGWSRNDVTLLEQWYTLDAQYETEDLAYIAKAHSDAKRYATPGIAVEQFRVHHPLIFASIAVLVLLGVFALLGVWTCTEGRWSAAALCTTGAACGALLLYLAWSGRLLVRSAMAPVVPAAAVLFCLLPACLPAPQAARTQYGRILSRILLFLTCAALGVCTLAYFMPTARNTRYVPPKWDYNTYAARDAVALEHPELLFLYSGDIVNDLRVFPDFSQGVPTNLLTWGGWRSHSEEYNAKLAAFGIDGDHFSAQDWLNPSLRLLTIEAAPNAALVTYLQEKLGQPVKWEATQMDAALWAYRFYTE